MVQLVMHRCDAPVTILTFINNLGIGQTFLIHMKYCVLSYPKNKNNAGVCVWEKLPQSVHCSEKIQMMN